MIIHMACVHRDFYRNIHCAELVLEAGAAAAGVDADGLRYSTGDRPAAPDGLQQRLSIWPIASSASMPSTTKVGQPRDRMRAGAS
jgi:hypothetical protein